MNKDAVEKLLDELRSAWRFRWRALAVAWLVAAIGWVVVFLLPVRYDTTARVYVDTNSLLRPLLEGLAVTQNNANEVDLVRRAMLGRPQLQRTIEQTDLHLRARTPKEMAGLVDKLTADVRVTGDPQSKLYTITYGDSDPKVSYEVVQNLLDTFVGDSLGAKRTDAENAQKFLVRQLKEYESRLTEAETRLADFKKKNVGYMPDDRGGYFERLQGDITELDRLESSIAVARNRRDELRARLLGEAPARGSTGGSISAVETSVDGRLSEARRRMEDLLLRYTEQHPDVLALRETINELEQQRERELVSLRSSRSLGTPRSNQTSLVLQNLQISLNETELELGSLESQAADRRGRVGSLRKNINVLPEVEAELARLNRDYEITRTQYNSLLQRLESARLTDEADRSEDIRFRIIDPPVLPLSPAAPKRVLLLFGVLFAALGAGGLAAWFFAQMNPVYFSLSQVRTQYPQVRMLGAIGSIVGPNGGQSKLAAVGLPTLYAVGIAALFAACVALVLVQARIG